MQFTHPQGVSASEAVPDPTVATRAELLDRASVDQSVVFAYHVSGLGHVEGHAGAYRFIPD